MLVQDVMKTKLFTVTPETTLPEALRLTGQRGVRHLPVLDGDRLVGIVSDRDLKRAMASPATSLEAHELNYHLDRLRVGEIMTRTVITIGRMLPIETAACLMVQEKIGVLPVTDDGRLVGLVTETDVLRLFVRALGAAEPSSRLDVVLDNRPHALAEAVQAVEAAGADISHHDPGQRGRVQGSGPPRTDDQPGSGRLGAPGAGIHGAGSLEGMMARLGVVGITAVWLLASGLGLGGARLDAQSREALVTQGRQFFTDKGCYGCHTIGAAGTPIAPDLRRVVARYSEETLARWLRDPAAQEPTRHMPNLQLSEAEARALAAYLASLR